MAVNLAKVVPEFLDEKFFDKFIRHIEKDADAKVSSFEVLPGSKPGENFASALFRGTITFKSKYAKDGKTLSVIIKTKPVLGPEMAAWADIIDKAPFFRNEMEVYGKILPEMQSLLLSAGDKDILAPKLLYQTNDPSSVIILEDLCVDGFDVIDRPPEDFEVSKKIIQRLAKFHAASLVLINDHKIDPSQFNHSIFENATTAEMLYGKGIAGFTEVMKEWDGYEKFVEQFEVYHKQYLSKVLKTYAPNRTEFGYNVLNHADFHVKNVLFKKNSDDKVDDFKFIDFQICNYASPAIDLLYSMYYFLTAENRQTRRGEFIVSYYNQFVASLKQFGYMKAPPSLIDLQVELLKNGNLEVILAVCNVVPFYYDFSTITAEDLDQGEGTKRFFSRLYNTPEYKEMIQKELPRFLYNGFI